MVRGPGWCPGRAGGRRWEKPGGRSWSQSPRLLDGTASWSRSGPRPEGWPRRLQVPAAPRGLAPAPSSAGRDPGSGAVALPGGQRATSGGLSPRSRRRGRQVGLPRASPAPAGRPGSWVSSSQASRQPGHVACHPPPARGVVPSRQVPRLGNSPVHQASLDGVRMTSGLESTPPPPARGNRPWRGRRASARGSGVRGAGAQTFGAGGACSDGLGRLSSSRPWKEGCLFVISSFCGRGEVM